MVCPPRMKGENRFPFPDIEQVIRGHHTNCEISSVAVHRFVRPRWGVDCSVAFEKGAKPFWRASLGKWFGTKRAARNAWSSWSDQLDKRIDEEAKRRAKNQILAQKQSEKKKRRNAKSK